MSEYSCCDYRDHSPGPCPCTDHFEQSALHPFGGVVPLTGKTSGATFMVGTVAFRCVDIIGTFTPLYECNRCSSVITDPDRHLARAACDD